MLDKYFDELIVAEIKKAREAKGWSIRELGRRADIPKASVTAYESLSRSMPFATFKKICAVLDLDYIEVFERCNEEFIRHERSS